VFIGRRRATPVTEVSIFTTEISASGMNIFPYEHTTKFVPVTEPDRQYEEALGTVVQFNREIVSFLFWREF